MTGRDPIQYKKNKKDYTAPTSEMFTYMRVIRTFSEITNNYLPIKKSETIWIETEKRGMICARACACIYRVCQIIKLKRETKI